MSENKEESNSTSSVKEEEEEEEEDSRKTEDSKTGESSKDSDKDSGKNAAPKKGSDKDDSENESEDDSDDEGRGLYDRPVELSGCRARKQVERLEVSFTGPKDKNQPIPEGRGQKLGECPRIEYHIQKTMNNDLKPLHKILFNRVGTAAEIKRNIRKFSGFSFVKKSTEFDRKKIAMERMTVTVLKHCCSVLDIEQGGAKDTVIDRLLEFLLEPKDSGKAVPKKKGSRKRVAKKPSVKKPKVSKEKKEKVVSSDDESDAANDNASDKSSEPEKKDDSEKEDSDDSSDSESENIKDKKAKPSKETSSKKADKKEKGKKDEKNAAKGLKRKRDSDDSEEDDEVDKPASKKKGPTDDELKKALKKILKDANLQEITMKKVLKQVQDAFPSVDLTDKKSFIKTTIKSILS